MKTRPPRKCIDCPTEFKPTGPNHKRCTSCSQKNRNRYRGPTEATRRSSRKYYQKHAERLKAAERARYRKKYGGLKREKDIIS